MALTRKTVEALDAIRQEVELNCLTMAAAVSCAAEYSDDDPALAVVTDEDVARWGDARRARIAKNVIKDARKPARDAPVYLTHSLKVAEAMASRSASSSGGVQVNVYLDTGKAAGEYDAIDLE